MPGKKPDCQFSESLIGRPLGHIATKPGRFSFSVPNPYMTQAPTLGRGCTESPQFISISDGSWLGTWACIERITAMSSAWAAVLAKISLISSPLWPYFLNLKGEGNAAPVLRSVVRLIGAGWPAYFWSAGFGSNVSTCDGPPLRKKWITRFAGPGKWGCLGLSLLSADEARVSRALWSAHNPARANAPSPMPERCSKVRRDMRGGGGVGRCMAGRRDGEWLPACCLRGCSSPSMPRRKTRLVSSLVALF